MDYLRIFRGLKEYDEEFGERAHQDGVKHEKQTGNQKSFTIKSNSMAHYDRSDTCSSVLKEDDAYKTNRPKRKGGDQRVQVFGSSRETNKRAHNSKRTETIMKYEPE